jgi:nucleoside 2-deoxyribosyltransferase
MNCFIACRETGENLSDLEKVLLSVRAVLKKVKIKIYCTFLDHTQEPKFGEDARDVMHHAFEKIDKSDFLLVIQRSSEKSEGMIMEIGYCLAKGIPILLAKKENIGYTYLPDMADFSFEFNDTNDLVSKLENFNFSKLKKNGKN